MNGLYKAEVIHRHEQVEVFAVEQATFKTGRGRAEPRCGARQDAEENCLTPPTRRMDAVNNRSDARLHLAQCGLQVGVQARAHDLGGGREHRDGADHLTLTPWPLPALPESRQLAPQPLTAAGPASLL